MRHRLHREDFFWLFEEMLKRVRNFGWNGLNEIWLPETSANDHYKDSDENRVIKREEDEDTLSGKEYNSGDTKTRW